jgi:hypothetical protein
MTWSDRAESSMHSYCVCIYAATSGGKKIANMDIFYGKIMSVVNPIPHHCPGSKRVNSGGQTGVNNTVIIATLFTPVVNCRDRWRPKSATNVLAYLHN